MSSTQSDDDSGIATDHLSADDPLDELDGVGPHRASELPYGSIEGLSRTTADQVYETDGITVSKQEAEHIMSQANSVMDNGSEAEVEQDDVGGVDGPDTVAVDELDPEPDEPVPDMEDADTVGIIVGMATSDAEESVLADRDDEELMAEFSKQLYEAGLDPDGEGWTPVILGEGMGRPETIRYLQQADHHEDVLQESADLNRHATARRAYKIRDEEFVEQDIDGLVAVANGEFVGKYVNLAYDANIPIHTPPMDDADDDPDGLDVNEA